VAAIIKIPKKHARNVIEPHHRNGRCRQSAGNPNAGGVVAALRGFCGQGCASVRPQPDRTKHTG
jgi:hypothetical protein